MAGRILSRMGTKSRETIYGASVRAAAERATEARKEADKLAVAAWNARMLGFQGPAQPSPTLGDAINAGFGYLEVMWVKSKNQSSEAIRRESDEEWAKPSKPLTEQANLNSVNETSVTFIQRSATLFRFIVEYAIPITML